MTALAWFGAIVLAIVLGLVAAVVGEYAYAQGWWLLGAPMRAADWVFGLWIILLIGYPLFQGVRRKPIIQTPFRLLAWPCLLVGGALLLVGAVDYAQEAFRLGGLLAAFAAFVFFPIGIFLVGIFGSPDGFLSMFVMGTVALASYGMLRGDEQ